MHTQVLQVPQAQRIAGAIMDFLKEQPFIGETQLLEFVQTKLGAAQFLVRQALERLIGAKKIHRIDDLILLFDGKD